MSYPTPDRPVRILHIAQATVTGVAVYVAGLAAYQRRQGLDVYVACPTAGVLADQCRGTGLSHLAWEATRTIDAGLGREAWSLRRIIKVIEPDVVHLHSSKAGLVGRLVIRKHVPTVFTPHAWSFLLPGSTQRPSLVWEKFATRWTTTTVVSNDEEAAFGRGRGVRGPFDIAEHGVDPALFVAVDAATRAKTKAELGLADVRTVVCVGRLCQQKGQQPLLAAWRIVEQACPDAVLVLVGDGEDEKALRAEAPESVRFVGARDDIGSWFAAADVAAQPSRYEALSFSVLEAMSAGRSVVAFDAIGMATALGDEAGAVVAMDDVEALAAALVQRLDDPDLCDREGRAGRRRVEDRFNVERLHQTATRATLQACGIGGNR